MAQIDEAKVQLVAKKTEEIRGTLLNVRKLLRETRASDPRYGKGRPNEEAEKELNKTDGTYYTSFFHELVVIGFWWSGGSPHFVCSSRGLNLFEAYELMSRAIAKGNKPHAKAKTAFEEFEKVSRQMVQTDPKPPTLEMGQLDMMIKVCNRDDKNAGAFAVTEAEARLFAYLMTNPKLASGEVHLYSTHSPCSGCGHTFERLASIRSKHDDIEANPRAYIGQQFSDFQMAYKASGLGNWKIGGLYYGRLYVGDERPTDLSQLERAKRNESIRCYKQFPPPSK